MTATITRATVVGGHDGRAEIEVELTYDNGGTSTISLDEDACLASLDRAGITSLDELVGLPWATMLPALDHSTPGHSTPGQSALDTTGEHHARPRHP